MGGSFTDWKPTPMEMDAFSPGIFKFQGAVGDDFYDDFAAYCEHFQITVDGDEQLAMYPEVTLTGSGEAIVAGPDRESDDRSWMIKSLRPYMTFEINFDLTAEDRRKIVTWKWVKPEAIED